MSVLSLLDSLAGVGSEIFVTDALKAAVVLTVAAIATLVMRRNSAAARHWVWTVGVCAVLLLPLGSLAVPSIEVPLAFLETPTVPAAQPTSPVPAAVPVSAELRATATAPGNGVLDEPAAPVRTTTDPPRALRPVPAPEASASAGSLPVSTRVPESEASAAPLLTTERTAAALLLIWLAGAAIALARTIGGALTLRRLARSTPTLVEGRVFERVDALSSRLGLRRAPLVLDGGERTVPMTWGVVRAVLMIPAEAESWERWRLDAVLTHELGHVKRRDYLTQLIAQFTCALHWFNPLAWVAAARMRIEREHACDDLVVRWGHEPASYAHDLVELARTLRRPALAAAALCFARPNTLKDRLVAVMDDSRNRTPLGRRTLVIASAFALALGVPLAALSAVPVDPTSPALEGLIAEDAPEPTTASADTEANSTHDIADPQSDMTGGGAAATEPPSAEVTGVGPAAMRAPVTEPSLLDGGLTSLARAIALPQPTRNASQEARVFCGPDDGEVESHLHSRSDETTRIELTYGECSTEVRIEGDIEFTEDFRQIASMPRGSMLRFDVQRPGARHRLEIEPDRRGEPTYDWRLDGDRRDFDADGHRWLELALVDLFRSSGYKAEERTAWILSQEGPEGVFNEVEAMLSDHAQSRYLTELLRTRDLRQSDVARAIAVASAEVDSDHALGEVLKNAATQRAFGPATLDAFIEATGSIESDHTQAGVLEIALRRDDLSQRQLETLLGYASAGIESDHQMAQLLMGMTNRYSLDASVRPAFLRAARTIGSDHNRAEVYGVVLNESALDASELAEILDAASDIQSDHNLAQLLLAATRHDLGNAQLRSAFLRAATSIESDHSRANVLGSALQMDGLTDSDLAAILDAVGSIESDHNASSVLVQVARRDPSGPALRRSYLGAARTIESDHNLAQALEPFVALDLTEAQTVEAIEVAKSIEADHQLGRLLVQIAQKGPVQGAVREAMLEALDLIDARHERGRVSEAMLRSN